MTSNATHPPMDRMMRAVRDAPLDGTGPTLIARAPGRLDIMGGIADYSGSLVCEMPLSIAACSAARGRTDGRIAARSAQEGAAVELTVADLGKCSATQVRELIRGDASWARYVVGCAWWLMDRHGAAKRLATGVSIAVDSDVPPGGGVSSSAAIEVATMTALCTLFDITMSPLELAVACQGVENHVVGAPCGVMDQVTSALGEADAMLELLCQPGDDGLPAQVRGHVPVPDGYAFIGIHSGVRHEVSGDPYTDTRVAAFMAQKILSTLEQPDLTRGWLANVDAQRYQLELRTRLPQRMTGRAFIEAHETTNDPVTTVDAAKAYAVRAAADHHVLEMSRVSRFVELMKAAGAADAAQRERMMREAGRLMVESHHSYGDCAQLGHAMTDRLVELAERIGPDGGVYGAKITGGGCGGTVALLVRDAAQTTEQINALVREYESATGRSATLFTGSGPGAATAGLMRMDEA